VLPRRRRPRLRTTIPRRDYPHGYRIEGIGPAPFGGHERVMDDPLHRDPK